MAREFHITVKTTEGLPPPGSVGNYIGFEANGQPHLLAWNPKNKFWASLTWADPTVSDTSELPYEALSLIGANEDLIVSHCRFPEDVA